MKQLCLLLDQMIDNNVADALRRMGHDVVRANEAGLAEADDVDIMSFTIAKNRLLLRKRQQLGNGF